MPHQVWRRKIVQGIEEPTPEEVEKGLEIEKEEEEDEEDEDTPRLEEIPEEGDEEAKETDDEKKEQQELRQKYIEAYRESMKAQLNSIVLVDEHGNKTKLKPKKPNIPHS